MKKTVKITLTGIGILLALFFLICLIFIMSSTSIKKKMTPVATGAINERVFAIQDSFVNMYLVKVGDQYIAFDAGNDAKHIEQELNHLNIEKEKVIAIFLTHTDSDHTAALGLFRNATISKQEEQMINGRTSRFLFFHTPFYYDYQLIDDEQTIPVAGATVQGILIPGHTPGTMAYLVDSQYLFVGDGLSLHDGKVGLFNNIFNMDSKIQRESIHKLANLSGVKYLFTAHYGMTDDYSKAFADWRE